jgi:hypothetical protein
MSIRVNHPVILVGALERHNFGDLLMGRVVAGFLRAVGMTPLAASILPADMRGMGGLRVHAFARLAGQLPPNTPIVHIGGETILMGMENALRMDVPVGIRGKLAADLSRMTGVTGLDDREFAYLTPASERIGNTRREWHNRYFHALGGHHCPRVDEATIKSVARNLAGARWLTVRDSASLEALGLRSVEAIRVVWDAGVLAGDITSDDAPEIAIPGSYLLVQMAAGHFDSVEEEMIEQIGMLKESFPKVVIAMAGVAAKHDSPDRASEFAERLRAKGVDVEHCPEVEIGRVVALIGRAACVLSSSLHFRMVALAHGVPRVSLCLDKVTAWAREHDPDYPAGCAAGHVAEMVRTAMAVDRSRARELSRRAREEGTNELRRLAAAVEGSDRPAHVDLPGLAGDMDGPLPLADGMAMVPEFWLREAGQRVEDWRSIALAAKEKAATARTKQREAEQNLLGLRKSFAGRLAKPLRWLQRRIGK